MLNKKELIENLKIKLSKNGVFVSNLVTYSLMLKNLNTHYKFCALNNSGQLVNKDEEKTPYLSLEALVKNNSYLLEEDAIISDRKITYGCLLEETRNLSNYMHHTIKSQKGENISICSNGSSEGIIAFFAMNKLGLVNARIFNGAKEERFLKNLIDFDSKTIFVDQDNLNVLSNVIKNTKVKNVILMGKYEDEAIEDFKLKNPDVNIQGWNHVQMVGSVLEDYTEKPSENDVASILYTSGSSGEAKPIIISNKVYVNMVDVVSTTTGIKKCTPEKAVGVVSHEYPYSAINSTIMVLLMGKTLIMPTQNKNSEYFSDLLKEKPEKIQAIPNFYKLLEEAYYHGKIDKELLSSLGTVVSGGETYLKEEKIKLLKFLSNLKVNPLLIDGFGFGEMGSATALKFGLNEYFLLMNGIEAKAIDPETLEDLPVDRQGILCLSGPSIADGYYNNQKSTKKSFITDKNGKKWFVSDTYGSVHGKFKRLIKLGGRIREYFITSDQNGNFIKVYAGNVENVIISTGCIEDCVVVPSDFSGCPSPVAYISLRSDCNLSKDEVIEAIKLKCKSLEIESRPTQITIEDEIKRTPALKKDYTYYKTKQLS